MCRMVKDYILQTRMAVRITGWIFAFCTVLRTTSVECQITNSPTAKEVCTGSNVELDWIYGDAANFATVTWTYIDSSSVETTIMQQVTGGSAIPVNNYNVVHKTNGGITLTDVTLSNNGSYKITVSYLSATPQAYDAVSVTVNDCSLSTIRLSSTTTSATDISATTMRTSTSATSSTATNSACRTSLSTSKRSFIGAVNGGGLLILLIICMFLSGYFS